MPPSRRQQVWDRAGGGCEYCQIPQEFDVLALQLDHIRAQKHRGPTTIANMALACLACNARKGPNAAGYDPLTDSLVPLFNPRTDDWDEHFRWHGPQLIGCQRRSVQEFMTAERQGTPKTLAAAAVRCSAWFKFGRFLVRNTPISSGLLCCQLFQAVLELLGHAVH